jgi:hypothetical protein
MRSLIPPLVVGIPGLVTLVVAARTWQKLQRGDESARNEVISWKVGASVLKFSPRSGPRLVYVLLRGAAAGFVAFGICVALVFGLMMTGVLD